MYIMRFVIISMCLCNVIYASSLQSLQFYQLKNDFFLYFTLNNISGHKIFILNNPDRLVVDLQQTNLAINLSRIKFNKNLITKVRIGYPKPQTLRLVFEMNTAVKIKNISSWRHNNKNQQIFSVNFMMLKPSPSRRHQLQPISVNKLHQLRDVVIILDPGHGGKDPGAIGSNHVVEKNVTLSIAQELKKIIDQKAGMHAELTRNGDYYVGLRERLQIARKYTGDLFVSIHADAFINKFSHGASIFALSARGATSEAARWLAAKENYSELGGVNLKKLHDTNGLIRTVLIDLSQTATINASLKIGNYVLKNLIGVTRLHNHHIEQARFMVLKSPDIPSVLIETGFISNLSEEYNLSNHGYQIKLSQAIFRGIKSYFYEYPPYNTRIALLVGNND